MSVNASCECEYPASVSLSESCSLRKLHRHCEDSAGSSVPFVFARSSFPPTVGRQASRQAGRRAGGLGWLLVWHSLDDLGKRGGKAHSHSWSHYTHGEQENCGGIEIFSSECPPLSLSLSLFDQKNKCVNWAAEQK